MTRSSLTGNGAIRTVEVCRHHTMGTSVIRAVDGISFSVQSGEFIALLGSSGSGKSSLLNLIAGLERLLAANDRVAAHVRYCKEELLSHCARHGCPVPVPGLQLAGIIRRDAGAPASWAGGLAA